MFSNQGRGGGACTPMCTIWRDANSHDEVKFAIIKLLLFHNVGNK